MPIRRVAGHELVQILHHSFAFIFRPLHGKHFSKTQTAGTLAVDMCDPNHRIREGVGNCYARIVVGIIRRDG
jgi:hypothetical protein